MEEQEKIYVTRTHCYGRRPHDNYAVTLASGDIAITETPTLGALLAAIPEGEYIEQKNIIAVMDALAKTGGMGQTGEERLSFAKEMLAREIAAYDTSDAVNTFSINGADVWLDKATRVGLMNSTTIAKAAGQKTTTLWLGDAQLEVKCDKAIQLLSALELYALACFGATAAHKKAVGELTDLGDVLAYDYTAGYPDKLEMEV